MICYTGWTRKSLKSSYFFSKVLNYSYYRNHERGSIKSANVNNLSDFQILLSKAGDSLKDIQVFSKRKQKVKNVCAVNNGGCEQLCLFNGTHPVCACPHGTLASDGKTCKGKH